MLECFWNAGMLLKCLTSENQLLNNYTLLIPIIHSKHSRMHYSRIVIRKSWNNTIHSIVQMSPFMVQMSLLIKNIENPYK
jgi:hypothetical protein